MTNITVPSGMTIVTKDEFFETLYADKRDIMPCYENPYFTVWQDTSRKVFGGSLPGWKLSGYPEDHPLGKKTYMLAKP
jgi:hypothetical protein